MARAGELLVYGTNPDYSTPDAEHLGVAHALQYEHKSRGPREHAFDGDEQIELLPDGSIRIYHPQGKKLWAHIPRT